MSYVLFLDDVRDPGWAFGDDCLIARNVEEAVAKVCLLGLPHTISFDHDLGKNQPTAMKFMWWLIECDLDGRYDLNNIKNVIIHSANPVGAQNLKALWDGYSTNELTSGVIARLDPR